MTKGRSLFPEKSRTANRTEALCGGLNHNSQGTREAHPGRKKGEAPRPDAHGKKRKDARQTLSNLYILKGADRVPRINIK